MYFSERRRAAEKSQMRPERISGDERDETDTDKIHHDPESVRAMQLPLPVLPVILGRKDSRNRVGAGHCACRAIYR